MILSLPRTTILVESVPFRWGIVRVPPPPVDSGGLRDDSIQTDILGGTVDLRWEVPSEGMAVEERLRFVHPGPSHHLI